MRCLLYAYSFLFPSASHPSFLFISQVFIYGRRHFCLLNHHHLSKALFNAQIDTRQNSLPYPVLFPYIWERFPIFEKRFLVCKNAEEEAPGKQYLNIFQVAIWGSVTLQQFLVVFDIQLPPFAELSPSPHILPHIWGQVFGLVKNWKMRKMNMSNSHNFFNF